jgi:hypothetical protein
VCKAHVPGLGAALVCPGLIAGAATLPLVWDWAPCKDVGCVSQPDGFRIYRVTQGHSSGPLLSLGTRHLADTQSDPTITIRGISPYEKTDCFVATAFKGSVESADSNTWCGSRELAMGTSTVSIPVLQSFTGYKWIEPYDEVCSLNYLPYAPAAGEGLVKYDDGNCTGAYIYHAFFGFDMSQYINPKASLEKVMFKADLKHAEWGVGHQTSKLPCAITGVGLAQPSVWWIPSFKNEPPRIPQSVDPRSDIDVTIQNDTVYANITPWFVSGGRAFGMGFSHTTDPIQPGDSCWSQFTNIDLDVTYYPSSS